MKKNNVITSLIMALLMSNGLLAHKPCKEQDPCVINTIVYLEEETEIDLGFEVGDYLPEDFDPYRFYFDINSVEYLTEDDITVELNTNLPEDFDPYAAPKDFRDISYIEPEEHPDLNIKTWHSLPAGIDTYISR